MVVRGAPDEGTIILALKQLETGLIGSRCCRANLLAIQLHRCMVMAFTRLEWF